MLKKLKITIFDKFIFSQVFQATLVCIFLFMIIWIAPETLVKILRKIFMHGMTIVNAIRELLYELPLVLGKALPVGILLGSLFTFDKLSKDSELAILRGIGLSFNRIMAPVLILGTALAVLCFYVNDKVVPAATMAAGDGFGYNSNFVYIEKDDQERPRQGIIVSSYGKDGIKNIMVINFALDEYDDVVTFESILFAPEAKNFDDKWVLPTAKMYHINKQGIYEDITDVHDYTILRGNAKSAFELLSNSNRKDRSFTNAQLWDYVQLLKREKYEDEHNAFLAKYYQRLLHPLTCILFAALGCLLGFSPPRSQRLIGFTVAVGVVFGYYITLPFFDLLAEKGVLFPIIAVSTPILLFLAAIFIIKKIRDL